MMYPLSRFLYTLHVKASLTEDKKDIIKKFIHKTKHITELKVNELASQLDLKPNILHEYLYTFVKEHFDKHIKEADDEEIEDQIEMGKKVEREHAGTIKAIRNNVKDNMIPFTDAEIFEMIAKDHLAESPKYYSYLKQMEKKFEKKGES